MKILHLAPDDKFMPFSQKVFEEAFPGGNHYRICGNPDGYPKFIKPGNNVEIVDGFYWRSDKLKKDLVSFDCLIVHFMTQNFMRAIKMAHEDMLVVWFGWGGDYYDLIGPYMGKLLLDKTEKLYQSIERKRVLLKPLRYILKGVRKPMKALSYFRRVLSREENITVYQIAERIDVYWVNPEEVDMMAKALPNLRAVLHRHCYYSAEDIFDVGPKQMAGPDILVGNSATMTNNHLELFDFLKQFDLRGRKLFCPLSYGDHDYGKKIARIGKSLFGDAFIPLAEYLPLETYYETLSSCGTVMMNHVRQQAGTTVATALYKGVNVILRRENPVYDFYRKMGIKLSTFDDYPAGSPLFFVSVKDSVWQRNKAILEDYWSYETAVKQARSLKKFWKQKQLGMMS